MRKMLLCGRYCSGCSSQKDMRSMSSPMPFVLWRYFSREDDGATWSPAGDLPILDLGKGDQRGDLQSRRHRTQVRNGRRRLADNLSTLFFCNSGIDRLLAGSSSVGNQFTFLHNRRQQASSRQNANRKPVELSCDLIQHTSSGDSLH